MATIQERALEELNALYEIRNAQEVLHYLTEYPELEDILIEAHSKIRRLFGEDAETVLSFWRNVEEETDTSLWISILTSLSAEKASKQLDLLDKWFIDIIPRSNGSLNFDTKRK
jgi:hypothetical protein